MTYPALLLVAALSATPAAQRPAASGSPAEANNLPSADLRWQGPASAAAPPLPPHAGVDPDWLRGAPVTSNTPNHVLFDRPDGESGELWAIGQTWKGSFDGAGFTFIPFFGSDAPHNFPLRVHLASAAAGEVQLPLTAGTVRQAGTEVRIDRGACVETIATAPRSIEQSFVFATLPNRGPLAVDVAIQGDFTAQAIARGVQFRNAHGSVTYTNAIAVDAAGKSLPLDITWDGDSAHITVPAHFVATAHLPLVVDPLFSTNSLAPNIVPAQRWPDAASLGETFASFVVWQRQFSATDWDCFACLAPSGASLQAVDVTSQNWQFPKVAANRTTAFLVVAQVDDQAGNVWIGGRKLWDPTAPRFDIERSGVVGLPGNNYRPDVGGDGSGVPGGWFCVVWEHQASPFNRDIHYKLVSASGALLTIAPNVLGNSSQDESAPSIAKDNRGFAWWIAYQRTFPFGNNDQDIWSAAVLQNGAIHQSAFLVSSDYVEEIRPCVTSSAHPTGSQGMHLITWEKVNSTPDTDIWVAAFSDTPASATTGLGFWNLSQLELGGTFASRNQIFPKADSDGARFLIGYSEYSGTDYDTYVSTVAFLPGTNTIRLEETRVPIGSNVGVDDYWTSIAASYVGPENYPAPRYLIAGAAIGTNDIMAWLHDGRQPGGLWTTRPTQCNGFTVSAGGVPAIGNLFSVSTSYFFGMWIFGTPASIPLQPLIGCNCTLGVDNWILVDGTGLGFLRIAIPPNPILVGSTWSLQNVAFDSIPACLGFFRLSDTLDFTIR